MKNKILASVYILTAVVIAVNSFFAVRDTLYFNMDDLPVGTEIHSEASESGNSILTIYKVENSAGTAIRAQVENGEDVRNLYWQTGLNDVDYGWVDEDVVVINDVSINIRYGSYDCRKGYSIFTEGAIEGKGVEEAPVRKNYE